MQRPILISKLIFLGLNANVIVLVGSLGIEIHFGCLLNGEGKIGCSTPY